MCAFVFRSLLVESFVRGFVRVIVDDGLSLKHKQFISLQFGCFVLFPGRPLLISKNWFSGVISISEYEFRISWYVMKYTLVCLNRMFARIATARVIAFSRSKHIDTTLMSLAGLIDLINRLIVWLIDYIRWISLFVV